MTESIFHRQIADASGTERAQAQKWIRRLVWKIAIATLMLMAVGSATRVMNAGLACPDWPLCYGQLIPSQQMNLQVFLEWFHRLDASLIGISTIALVGCCWWYRQVLPKWLPASSVFALSLIIFQGILGGLTVTQLLRFDIVTAHLATALLFLSTLIAIGTNLLPNSREGERGRGGEGEKLTFTISSAPQHLSTSAIPRPTSQNLYPLIGSIAAIAVYVQCILGGLVASRWSLHQCLGNSRLCLVMNSHIVGVFPATIAVALLVWFAWRNSQIHPNLKKLANIAAGLVLLQIILGIATYYLHLQVEPLTVTHHTVGASLLGTLVAFTVVAIRD
jgi:cytochrome c oxidase assembly protein subunit 15